MRRRCPQNRHRVNNSDKPARRAPCASGREDGLAQRSCVRRLPAPGSAGTRQKRSPQGGRGAAVRTAQEVTFPPLPGWCCGRVCCWRPCRAAFALTALLAARLCLRTAFPPHTPPRAVGRAALRVGESTAKGADGFILLVPGHVGKISASSSLPLKKRSVSQRLHTTEKHGCAAGAGGSDFYAGV